VAAELTAAIETVPGAAPIADGWRGIIDFGEVWTEDDADLTYPPGSDPPLGESLAYGCEITFSASDSEAVSIRLIALDFPRPVMAAGAQFTLRDGGTPRATGRLT
jgi:hypothetical protein